MRPWTPEYRAWVAMRQRCTNKNLPDFKYYGGRGICFCKRWNSFQNFLSDMGEKPSLAYSLDRINVNGNYEPGNCRWADKKQQSRNRQDTVYYKNKPLKDWCDELGIIFSTAYDRIRHGHKPFTARPRCGADRREFYVS